MIRFNVIWTISLMLLLNLPILLAKPIVVNPQGLQPILITEPISEGNLRKGYGPLAEHSSRQNIHLAVADCPPYTAVDSFDATEDYDVCIIYACPGDTIIVGDCSSGLCKGDQYIRLLNNQNVQVSSTETGVGCGSTSTCTEISYTLLTETTCQTFSLYEGCSGSAECAGQMTLSDGGVVTISYSPTTEPTPNPTDFPTPEPTSAPTVEPTAEPTVAPTTPAPTALPTLAPTPVPSLFPTLEPTPDPTMMPTTVPSAVPSPVPTPMPTASPTVPVFECPDYAVVDTYNATVNYDVCGIKVCPGDNITISNCDGIGCSGEQFLALYDANETEILTSFHGCGASSTCTGFSYHVPLNSECQVLSLHEGCLEESVCSGTVTVIGAYIAPTPAYTAKPTSIPTPTPISDPTQEPTTNAHKSSEISLAFKLDPNSSPTVALYMFSFISILMTMFIFKIRGGMKGIVNTKQFRLSYLAIPLNVIASVSNICLVPSYLFQGGFAQITAYAIVAIRSSVILICLYLIHMIFFRKDLAVFLNADLLLLGRYSWTAVLIIALFDISCLRFLPWTETEFACRSNGFPTMWFFKVCMYSQLFVAFVSIVTSDVQSLELASLTSCIFSVVSFLLNAVAILMGIVADDIKQFDTTVVSKKDATMLSTITSALWTRISADGVNSPRSSASSLSSYISSLSTHSQDSKEIESQRKKLEEEKEEMRITADRLERMKQALGIDGTDEAALKALKPFKSSIAYADENTNVLTNQLLKAGIKPLEFIPLATLRAELTELFLNISQGQQCNEKRVDYLLACMEVNPEYIAEKIEQDRLWRMEVKEFTENALVEMRAFIPPFIFTTNKAELLSNWDMSADLAKRLLDKKCLWLLRMTIKDIERLHEADLLGRYSYEAQGLDIIELAALYAAVPTKFGNDGSGKKQIWLGKLENTLKQMMADQKNGKLSSRQKRHPAYKDEEPLFGDRMSMHQADVFKSEGAFNPRQSFRSMHDSAVMGISSNDMNEVELKTSDGPDANSSDGSNPDRRRGTLKGSRVTELAKVITNRMSMSHGRPSTSRSSTFRASKTERPSASMSSKPRTSLWESDSDSESVRPTESGLGSDGDVSRQSLTEERKQTRSSLAAIFARTLFSRNSTVTGENPQLSAANASSQPQGSSLMRTPSLVPGFSSQNPTTNLARVPSTIPASAANPIHSTTKPSFFSLSALMPRTRSTMPGAGHEI